MARCCAGVGSFAVVGVDVLVAAVVDVFVVAVVVAVAGTVGLGGGGALKLNNPAAGVEVVEVLAWVVAGLPKPPRLAKGFADAAAPAEGLLAAAIVAP